MINSCLCAAARLYLPAYTCSRFASIANVVLLVVCLLPIAIQGADIHVPADYVRIQDALDKAVEQDTVWVSAGSYYENLVIQNKAIALVAVSGSHKTSINGSGTNTVIAINGDGSTGRRTVRGFLFTNGVGNGGAMRIVNASPYVEECIFHNSTGSDSGGPGGIMVENGEPLIVDSRITNNSVGMPTALGSGLHIDSLSVVTLLRCRVDQNLGMATTWRADANFGGALYVEGGILHATHTMIYGNWLSGIHNDGGTVNLLNSLVNIP